MWQSILWVARMTLQTLHKANDKKEKPLTLQRARGFFRTGRCLPWQTAHDIIQNKGGEDG